MLTLWDTETGIETGQMQGRGQTQQPLLHYIYDVCPLVSIFVCLPSGQAGTSEHGRLALLCIIVVL